MIRINTDCKVEKISEREDDDYLVVYNDNILIINNTAGEMLRYVATREITNLSEIITYFSYKYNIPEKNLESDFQQCIREFIDKKIIICDEEIG